ncbi:MAG: hypothetical protein HXX17_17015 [Geobacteraceae bacterium]|nr:hypothetical protein [Geobacteraceae bacterium]
MQLKACLRKTLLLLLLAVLTVPFGADSAVSAESKFNPPKILILNSYHQGYTWSDKEMEGVITTLRNSGLTPEIHSEFLDSKYFPKNEHFDLFKNLISFKYGEKRPDIVITLDDPAFVFAIQYRKSLFDKIPVVFAGLSDFEQAMVKGETGVTGVVEKQDVVGTVKYAKKMHPDLKEVLILHDFTSTGLSSRKEAEEVLPRIASLGISFRYLPEMTIDEVTAVVRTLKPGTIILPFSYGRDKAGRIFTHSELAEIVSKNASVPVYSTKVERLGHGVLGGSLLEGRAHGEEAAGIALRVLRGESPDAIPVILHPKSVAMFDRKVMSRFGVTPADLPGDSQMINNPPGFYRQHATVINISSVIILVIISSTFFMNLANKRRMDAEEALLQAERGRTMMLEAANSEMESFLYAVSHDLQAPLRRINSYSTILSDEYAASLEAQAQFYLERLKVGTSEMSALINNILALANISKKELFRTRCNLGKLALDIFNGLVPQFTHSITFTADEGMMVDADRKMMKTVLDNLLLNACKFTRDRVVAEIHLGSYVKEQQTVFFLSDNGAGFDMQYIEKLFAPFQRLHSEAEYTGNGIGLAIVQRIIIRHGGRMWAESAPGEGATFFFTLPS